MVTLDVTFSDGSHSHAWGGVDWIETAIEKAATRGLAIVAWSLGDEEGPEKCSR